jgi:dTDP-4-amino-4,6-dideoxygalactose transaminase
MAIYVTRSSMPDYEEYCNEIKDIWDTHWLTNNGAKHRQLEESINTFLQAQNTTLFTNGHLALECIIAAMHLSGEIITTPFTFVSTSHAISRNGLKPVFCDINPVDYTIDTNKIESLINEKTTAIIPVHVYGNMCNVEAIQKIADKYNLKVIYDAAHAFGVTYKGTSSANFGDASMFSFHATKVFNTIEGVAVCYKDSSLCNALNALKNFGISDSEDVEYISGNAKMNEFQAAMGICNLRHLDSEIQKRKAVAEKYQEYLYDIKGIKIWEPQRNVKPNYAYFPIMVDEEVVGARRDDIFARLGENGVTARKYFYPVINSLACYRGIYDPDDTPIALKISKRILCLPIFADLQLSDVERICKIIKYK